MQDVAVYRGERPRKAKQKRQDFFGNANARVDYFFGSIWNVVRFAFLCILLGLTVSIVMNSLAEVPPGGSLTMSIILRQAYKTIYDFNSKIPVLRGFLDWFGDLISVKEVNFLIFLSSFIVTLGVLSCLCH